MAKKKTKSKKKTTRKKAPKAVAGRSESPKTAPAGRRPLKGLLTRKIREAKARKVLLFVSTGNTCRSPMAAAYFKKLLEERKIKNIDVRSAGVMTIAGLLATDESKLMLEPYNVDLERHRSQPLTEEILRRADMVLGMTPFHVQMALRLTDAAREKTHLLKEYAKTDAKNRPIPDPMGCTLEVYKRCFRQIKQACDKLIGMPFITGKPVKSVRSAAQPRVRAKVSTPRTKGESASALVGAGTSRSTKRSSRRRRTSTKSSAPSSARTSRTRRTTAKKG